MDSELDYQGPHSRLIVGNFTLAKEWRTPCFDRLSALDWPLGFAITHHGVKIGIRANDASLLADIEEVLPEGCAPHDGSEVDVVHSLIKGQPSSQRGVVNFSLAYINHTPMCRSRGFPEALRQLGVNIRAMTSFLSDEFVFVHAGVVSYRGKAIILPGRTHAGKSTLVHELVRRGATYYCDEYALLDDAGHVHPYAKPIMLRVGEGGGAVEVQPDEIGMVGSDPVPVGLIVDTHFSADSRFEPRSIKQGEAVLALLGNSAVFRRTPEKALAVFEKATASARAIRSPRGEAAEAAAMILEQVECLSTCAA